jgi:hypothetical protein
MSGSELSGMPRPVLPSPRRGEGARRAGEGAGATAYRSHRTFAKAQLFSPRPRRVRVPIDRGETGPLAPTLSPWGARAMMYA